MIKSWPNFVNIPAASCVKKCCAIFGRVPERVYFIFPAETIKVLNIWSGGSFHGVIQPPLRKNHGQNVHKVPTLNEYLVVVCLTL